MIIVQELMYDRLRQTTSHSTQILPKLSSSVECKLTAIVPSSNIYKYLTFLTFSSSGATTMIAVSHLWRDEGLTPPLTGLYLSLPSPCIVSTLPEKHKSRVISWEQNKNAPVFNRASNEFSFRKRLLFPLFRP